MILMFPAVPKPMSFYKQNNKIMNKNLKLEINKKSYTSRKSEGFTLIEVLVSSAILVILAAGFIGLQYITSQHQVSAWKNYLNVEAANNSLSLIARELRDARQSETGAYPVFSYYNSDWPSDTENNPLAPASRISDTREIKIYLKTNYKNNDSDNDYILETFVRLRMLD